LFFYAGFYCTPEKDLLVTTDVLADGLAYYFFSNVLAAYFSVIIFTIISTVTKNSTRKNITGQFSNGQ